MLNIDTQQLVKVIEFWRQQIVHDDLVERETLNSIDQKSKEVVDIIGIRRCGKSTILKLLIKKLQLKDNFLYLNFEDPFFLEHNHPQVFMEAVETYEEFFSKDLHYLFFDEVQAVDKWEKAIRTLRDIGRYKIYITGSSSKLLSSELASVLTGRHLTQEVMPLSFLEFLTFSGHSISNKKDLILKRKILLKEWERFLLIGGFPEIAVTKNLQLLKQYFWDIIQRDIVMRHQIRDIVTLERLALFIISNSAKTISIESLKKTFNVSFKMVANYLEYFKECFLFIDVPQFAYSLKKQQKALKKYYTIDCGLANAAALRFSEDKGRMLENAVLLYLKHRKDKIYYYKTKNNLEVDFIVCADQGIELVIQVSWSLVNKITRDREIRALVTALKELGLRQGLILTENEEEELKVDGVHISIKPAFQWILSESLKQP